MSTREEVVERTKIANQAWRESVLRSEAAQPDDGYAERLRAIAAAGTLKAAALEFATINGVTKKKPNPVARQFPVELRPIVNRPGDAELWKQFDATVEAVLRAEMGASVSDLSASLRFLSRTLDQLAASVDRERGVSDGSADIQPLRREQQAIK